MFILGGIQVSCGWPLPVWPIYATYSLPPRAPGADCPALGLALTVTGLSLLSECHGPVFGTLLQPAPVLEVTMIFKIVLQDELILLSLIAGPLGEFRVKSSKFGIEFTIHTCINLHRSNLCTEYRMQF